MAIPISTYRGHCPVLARVYNIFYTYSIVLFRCANCQHTNDELKKFAEELADDYDTPIVTYLVGKLDGSCSQIMQVCVICNI